MGFTKVSVFENLYSQVYDSIHAEKNYQEDIEKILDILEEFELRDTIRTVLDFGCGTGKHISILEANGFDVQGYDPSLEMLQVARKNFPSLTFSSELSVLNQDSDLVVSLFDVLSYQNTPEKLEIFFSQLHFMVASKGYILLDFWNLEGVRNSPPENRAKVFVYNNKKYERRVVANHFEDFKLTELSISVRDYQNNTELYSELHVMRAFDLEEITELISPRFELVACRDAKDYKSALGKNSWRAVVLLRAQ
jgi:SAM-dependent methyltransferase